MPSRTTRRWIRLAALTCAMLAIFVVAAPASAHDPIFLTEDQISPDTGPYLPDGTISFAIYGSLHAAGDTRGFEFDLRDGDDLYLSLLIPDLEPETGLADSDLPTMTLTLPDGTERAITADSRVPFADPFSGTNYVTLFETQEPATGGRHRVVVTGASPTRFVVAVGTTEEFFTPTERAVDRPESFPGIAEPLNVWYTTPADGSEPVNAVAGGEVDVDVDLIEEELAALQEQETGEVQTTDDTTEDATESASAVDSDAGDGGSSSTWVAPVVLGLVAIIGGGLYFRRRQAV